MKKVIRTSKYIKPDGTVLEYTYIEEYESVEHYKRQELANAWQALHPVTMDRILDAYEEYVKNVLNEER